jgi:zinc transport system substrate-binding protein
MRTARIRFLWIAWGLASAAAALLLVAGCKNAERPTAALPKTSISDSRVAVSSPYLEAAVCEVLGGDVGLVRLAGPSMCPGHFDMRPSQIHDLARCGVLVRFDFQESLDAKLGQRPGGERKTVAVHVPGGLCVPDSYVAACRQIADHFVSGGALTQRQAGERLALLDGRMAALRKETARQIDVARLRDARVLSSGHQTDFCRWLGLRVVGTIASADAAGISDIEKSIKAGESAKVRLIVANEPEGRQSADALADRLGARVVVFGNFPSPNREKAFDELVCRNVTALLDAARLAAEQP